MSARPVARSAHFVVHFLAAVDKLSTGAAAGMPPAVDDRPEVGADAMRHAAHAVWRLGLVLPKRLARRSVTRSLIKHQARELWRDQIGLGGQPDSGGLPAGDWVLRLKAPWPVAQFPSAASAPLKAVVRDELQTLLAHCVRRTAVPEGVR
jgi:ribonuclease P protein component